ncbi:Vitamin B12 transporter BtuB [Pseudoalteromonas sp. CIP111854]|uniref:Vitamin B12 transporter BtuB n=1 Tax=Pseudoalteromonas holothuriae TaxID=2963714 RepID=A0A9W4VM43_9GAMM|nr:TonB-dependent receptor [Pseudoalteromonas sp. CIP111854]CAH9050782.1 Vitamin B12 transporter BtuB [Pseudoalteromonas sp. CIP111854]
MNPRFSYSLLALTLVQIYPYQANAETLAGDNVERITVTSTRTAKANTDLPLSIGSVSSQTLANDNAQHISDSLQTISGVLLNQLSGGQGHNAAIRMPINFGGYTLYLQDNIPLQSAAFYNHNALWWASSNASLSRLEVLKGAGTSLYGSGAVAATVNVISAPIATNSNTLSLTFAEQGYKRFAGSFTQLNETNDGFRVSGAYLSNDGWRTHSAVNKAEINLLHEKQLDDKQHFKTSLVVSSLEQQMLNTLTEAQFIQDPTQAGLPEEVLQIDPKRKTDYFRLSTEYRFDSNDFYASVIPYARYRTNDYIATWQPNMPKVESTVTSFGVLALSNFIHSSGGETTLGVDVEHSSGEGYSFQPTERTTSGWGAATYPKDHVFYKNDTTFIGVSPYVQHLGYFSPNLSYSLGVRFDHNKYTFDNALPVYSDDGFGNRSIASRSDTFKHLSPKLSLNYLLNAQSSIYSRYAQAIRIPTASQLYDLKTEQSSAQLGSINEETSDTYEVGYKANFDKLSIELAYYLMDVNDAIVTAYDDLGASYRVNASSVEHTGAELGLTYNFNKAFSFALAYSQSKHEFKHYIQDKGRVDRKTQQMLEQDLSGKSLQMAPDYVANIRFNYTSQTIAGLFVTAEVQSIGDYYLNVENTQQYSGYTVINFKANYALTNKLKLHARVSNFNDRKYALQNEIRYGRTRIQPGAPRTLYVGLKYQF